MVDEWRAAANTPGDLQWRRPRSCPTEHPSPRLDEALEFVRP